MKITATYNGNTKTTITNDRGNEVLSVAPAEYGGDGSAYGPSDFVGVGLASCVLTVSALWAEGQGLSLAGASAEVDKGTSGGRIRRLAVTLKLPSDFPVEKRAGLEHAAEHCPVHASLSPEIDAPISFEYSVAGSAVGV